MTPYQRVQVLASFLAASGIATVAHAQQAPNWVVPPPAPIVDRAPAGHPHEAAAGDNFMARPLAVYAQTSLGGPYGALGGSVDYSLSRFASVEAGAGVTTSGGPEFGAMARPRLALSPGFAIGVGLGLSTAPNWERPFDCLMAESACTPRKWSTAGFAHGEAFIEGRTGSGFSVRGYIGDWTILNPTPDHCTGACQPLETRSEPYIGVAFGGSM